MKRKNIFFIWYQQIDIISFVLILTIMCFGILLIATASPPIAEKLNLQTSYFIKRQLIYLFISIISIIFLSFINEKMLKRLSLLGFILIIASMIILLFIGVETKGAKRWINIFGFSFQPSEFLKPFYTIIISIILSQKNTTTANRNNFIICMFINAFVIMLLMLQPDFGMTISITVVTIAQLFIAGLRLSRLIIIFTIVSFCSFAAYLFFPHITTRIDKFLSSSNKVNYQVEKSLESYVTGGLTGKGPGEGNLKFVLPDSHTDFIFAVAGEEFGTLFCILIIGLFAFFIIRGLFNLTNLNNLFHMYASFGLLMYYSIQAIFNIGVTLNLFPTKGMTLPFISYGGSSMLACSIAAGIYLNFTRKNLEKSNYITSRSVYVNH